MQDKYTVNALVIPRSDHPENKDKQQPHMLGCCLAFLLVRPDPDKDGKHPEVALQPIFKNWPEEIRGLLKDAKLSFKSKEAGGFEETLPFDQRPARDVYHSGWKVADANRAWKELFAKVIDRNFDPAKPQKLNEPVRSSSTPEKVYRQAELTPDKVSDFVNPESASNLKPSDRFESLNTLDYGNGLAAAQLQRTRLAVDDATRLVLDQHLIRQLDADTIGYAVARLQEQAEHQPGRFSADMLTALDAVTLPAEKEPIIVPVGLMPSVLNHRELLGHVVQQVIDSKREDAMATLRRYERLNKGSRNRNENEQNERKKAFEKLEDPYFEELWAKVRQYPGLARRLSLVVHGTVDLPKQLLSQEGTVQLILPAASPHFDVFVTPRTWYDYTVGEVVNQKKKPGSFRPLPRNELFYGTVDQDKESYRKFHTLAGQLYESTQDDFVPTIGRDLAERNENTIVLDEDALPTAAEAIPDPQSEYERHRLNSVQFVSKPKITLGVDKKGVPVRTAQNAEATKNLTVSPVEAYDQQLKYARDRKENKNGMAGAGYQPSDVFAEDLMQGYTVFARHAIDDKKHCDWGSLCRRVVHVQPKVGTAFQFEEEGFIASGVTNPPKAVVGVYLNPQGLVPLKAPVNMGIVLQSEKDADKAIVKEVGYGLQPEDQIVKVNGQAAETVEKLFTELNKVGDSDKLVTFEITRAGGSKTLVLPVLLDKPANVFLRCGVLLKSKDKKAPSVVGGSMTAHLAQEAGLSANDFIVEVNRKPITTVGELIAQLAKVSSATAAEVQFKVKRPDNSVAVISVCRHGLKPFSSQAYLGMKLVDVPGGEYPQVVEPGPKAKAAGLEDGDFIQRINGEIVNSVKAVEQALENRQSKYGRTLVFQVLKKGGPSVKVITVNHEISVVKIGAKNLAEIQPTEPKYDNDIERNAYLDITDFKSEKFLVTSSTRYAGNFVSVVTPYDLKHGDYVFVTLGQQEASKSTVAELDVFPILKNELGNWSILSSPANYSWEMERSPASGNGSSTCISTRKITPVLSIKKARRLIWIKQMVI
ncbi:MAG: hypothetical protein QM703_14185 [Gemmatales bacterium]